MELIYLVCMHLNSSMFFKFKLVFIFLLFAIQLFLIISHSPVDAPNKVMQSGFNGKNLKSFLTILGGATAYFSAIITVNNEIKDTKLKNLHNLLEEERNNIKINIEKGKVEHQRLLTSIENNRDELYKLYGEKTKIIASNDRLLTIHNNIKDKVTSFERKSLEGDTRLSELGVIDQLIALGAKNFGEELTDFINKFDFSSSSQSNSPSSCDSNSASSSEATSSNSVNTNTTSSVLNTDIKESSMLPINFIDLKALLLEFETLSGIKKIAVAMLLCKSVIFSAVVSIIFVFYGNILLKKYDIKNKYPKLAKIIELRQKFQKYYLNYYIILILLVVITEVSFALALLLL
jgi:hypothetical protein